MATTVTIQGSSYSVPTQSDSPPWGSELNETVVALADAVNSLSGTNDIPVSIFQLANNQSVAANITGFSFNIAAVRSFIAQYNISRSTNSSEESEVGTLYGTYSTGAATWDFSQTYGGSSTVVFSITTGGQVQYSSGNMSGTSYTGKITFLAKSFAQ